MKTNLLAVLLLVVLSGCAEIDALRAGIANHGADASDQAIESALWALCNGLPVGAINRRFKTEEEKAAYREFCPGNALP